MGAVRSIDLMDAHHTTLQSDVSSNAFLSLNDVIRDLSVLHWQECCIMAVETINCVTDFSSWLMKHHLNAQNRSATQLPARGTIL